MGSGRSDRPVESDGEDPSDPTATHFSIGDPSRSGGYPIDLVPWLWPLTYTVTSDECIVGLLASHSSFCDDIFL